MVVRKAALFAAFASVALCACPSTKPSPTPPPDEVCGNGIDDDQNGKTDCADPHCFQNAACGTAFEICDNQVDDDGNSLVDCADSACAQDPGCAGKQEICEGGVDEDLDGKIDCADTDCASSLPCRPKEICNNNVDDNGDPQIDCADPTCTGSPFCPSLESGNCTDATDNDGDLAVDCQDADCSLDPACGCGSPPRAGCVQENNDTTCSNGADDDGDFLVDCQDGSCLSTEYCRTETDCSDGVDNDKDGKKDCADPDCTQTATCQGTAEVCTDNLDNDSDGQIDCADFDCNLKSCGTGCLCKANAKAEEACTDTFDNDADGKADCQDPDCTPLPVCNGGSAEASKCNDRMDNDNDGLTDCADTADCPDNTACGNGCVCLSAKGKETSCADLGDNDYDGLTDCADPDCAGALPETCGDGKDNDCDGAIDCADSFCASQTICQQQPQPDGAPCSADNQCQGGKCLSEATKGYPNGMCSNAASCSVSAQTGCNGGLCVESGSFDVCYPKCTGKGLGTTGACRAGYACIDPDSSVSGNSYCLALCTEDAQCAGSGTNYGCNPWSHLCEVKDKAKAKYGAPCTANSDCESNQCATQSGDGLTGGYCFGYCNATLGACGGDGYCYWNSAWGDNVGICYDGCTANSQCRTQEWYTCQNPSVGSTICWCRPNGSSCTSDAQCCGYCDTGLFGTDTCYGGP